MAVKHTVIEHRDSADETGLNHIERVLETIQQQKKCCVNSEGIKGCEEFVRILGVSVIPSTTEEYLPFMDNIEKIQKLLVKVIEGKEMVFATLHALYKEISDPMKQPSPTMSIVLQLIHVNEIPSAVRWILQNRYNKGSLQQAINTLCTWLTKWTFTPNLGPLVFEFIKGLEVDQHFDILINVTLSHIENLFIMVVLPECRQSVGQIVLHMLSSMQHSPEAFHKIIPIMDQVLPPLERDASNERGSEFLDRLVNLCFTLMENFPSYPINKTLTERLLRYKAEKRSPVFYKPWSDSNTNAVTTDNAAEKVGLNNLGNTCYMNSVLQALFMTKTFRNEVLLKNADGMPIFSKLQALFALLQFSSRSSLSPSEILSIARPPGFQPGHQHDSSEFLGYLLDALHEQELCLLTNNHAENHSASSSLNQLTIVKRSFGGRTATVSKCCNCGTLCKRLDTFLDLQLSFPSASESNLSVQKLLDYYFKPEILSGDNQYHCDSCGLTDGERETRIVEPPPRLVLTLKHFRYDPATQSRTKILQRVQLDSDIVVHYGDTMEKARYNLYAAVVHCGPSVDSGHYYTYARDTDEDWYKFSDCFVTNSRASELCALRPPEAPYILFYNLIDCEDAEPVSKSDLSHHLQNVVHKDDEEAAAERRSSRRLNFDVHSRSNFNGGGGDDPPPPGCGGGGLIDSTQNRFVC